MVKQTDGVPPNVDNIKIDPKLDGPDELAKDSVHNKSMKSRKSLHRSTGSSDGDLELSAQD